MKRTDEKRPYSFLMSNSDFDKLTEFCKAHALNKSEFSRRAIFEKMNEVEENEKQR